MTLKDRMTELLKSHGPLTLTEINKKFKVKRAVLLYHLRYDKDFISITGLDKAKWDVKDGARNRLINRLISHYCWDYEIPHEEVRETDFLLKEKIIDFYDDSDFDEKYCYFLSDDYVKQLCDKGTQCCSVCRDFGCRDNANYEAQTFGKIIGHSKYCRCKDCDEKRVDSLVAKKIKENKEKRDKEEQEAFEEHENLRDKLDFLLKSLYEKSNLNFCWEQEPYKLQQFRRLERLKYQNIHYHIFHENDVLYKGTLEQCIKYVEANKNNEEFLRNLKEIDKPNCFKGKRNCCENTDFGIECQKCKYNTSITLQEIMLKKLQDNIRNHRDMYFGTITIDSKILTEYIVRIRDNKEMGWSWIIERLNEFFEKK